MVFCKDIFLIIVAVLITVTSSRNTPTSTIKILSNAVVNTTSGTVEDIPVKLGPRHDHLNMVQLNTTDGRVLYEVTTPNKRRRIVVSVRTIIIPRVG